MPKADVNPPNEYPESAAVIVGGGLGIRFGGDKLSISLAGKPLLAWSLEAFRATPAISSIVIVVPAGSEEKFREIGREAGISKLPAVVSGGAERHESVLRGLNALPSTIELVAIHDAARPLVTPDLIMRCLGVAIEVGAAAAAAPVTDTLHESDQEKCAARTVDRTALWAMQTPQVFRLAPLLRLLENIGDRKPTDEVSLVLAAGWRVPFVESLKPNFKVTWPEDVALQEAFLKIRISHS